MLKRMMGLAIAILVPVSPCANAAQGALFNVTTTGTPADVVIRLCLNGIGELSCQNYQLSALSLQITPTILNHVYPYIGIKVLTPEYSLSNIGLDCLLNPNGYCLFSASQSQPKSLYLIANRMPVVSVGTDGSNNNSVPLSYTSTNAGVDWALSTTQPPVNSSGGGQLFSVACSSNGISCTAVGNDASNVPLSYVSTNGGIDWVPSTPFDPSGQGVLYGVACSSNGTTCTAVGNDVNNVPLSYVSTNAGADWALSAMQPMPSSNQGYLSSVACSSNGAICTAVGYDVFNVPLSYTSTSGGVNWALSSTQPPVNPSGGGQLFSVACSSNGTTCTAVGHDNDNVPLSYTSTNGGVNWVLSRTQPPVDDLGQGVIMGVACSSNGAICTAVGYDGNSIPLSYTSTNGGVDWVVSLTQPPVNNSNQGTLLSVVCTESGYICTAVGYDGTSKPLSYTTTNGGQTWTASTTQPPVNSSFTGSLNGVG